jgi:hypothetical protein
MARKIHRALIASDWLHVFTIHDAKVSNFQEYWTPTHGQPHITVRNPLPAGKALYKKNVKLSLKLIAESCRSEISDQ